MSIILFTRNSINAWVMLTVLNLGVICNDMLFIVFTSEEQKLGSTTCRLCDGGWNQGEVAMASMRCADFVFFLGNLSKRVFKKP